MNDDELYQAYRLAISLQADKCKANYYRFFCDFWEVTNPNDLIANWHIKYMCNRLQFLYERWEKGLPARNMIINVPPGSTKTTNATILFPVWCWVRNPSIKTISGSYAMALSIEQSVKSRDILKSEKFALYYPDLIKFKNDMDNKGYYQNTSMGARITTSVDGTSTGRHGDFIIIDDPINPKKAASELERKNASDWVSKTLSSRKTDKKRTVTILIMQRLHDEDPTGFMLELGGNIEHICIPAEITELDNISPKRLKLLYKDGLLDPNRMDREVLDYQREILGGIEYGGQYLQSPRDAEGNIFKREWIEMYNDLPRSKPLNKIQSWDTAYKIKQENDYSVCTTWHEYESGYYLVDFWMQKVEYTELKNQIQLQNQTHRPFTILIEDKASGQSVIQELKRLNLPLRPIIPLNDKIVRANQITPPFEAENVYFPYREFTEQIIEQLTGFPNTKHDDIVDSITQALSFLREYGSTPVFASAKRKTSIRGYHG